MKDLHSLLKKQLKKHLNKDVDNLEKPLRSFVKAVNESYCRADAERDELARSLEISSEELKEADENMNNLLWILEEKVSERTAELELSQQALKKSEERLRVIYETAPVGIFQSDPSGNIFMSIKDSPRCMGMKTPLI